MAVPVLYGVGERLTDHIPTTRSALPTTYRPLDNFFRRMHCLSFVGTCRCCFSLCTLTWATRIRSRWPSYWRHSLSSAPARFQRITSCCMQATRRCRPCRSQECHESGWSPPSPSPLSPLPSHLPPPPCAPSPQLVSWLNLSKQSGHPHERHKKELAPLQIIALCAYV